VCIAVPGRVASRDERGEDSVAQVDFDGVVRDVCLAYVPEVQPGDWVLVQFGFAIERLDERSAREILALMAEAGIGPAPVQQSSLEA
jgi:hydrogenase expression/formation protein HypC